MATATAIPATKRVFSEIPPSELDLVDLPAALPCKLDGADVSAFKRQFSTGSLGWFASGEYTVNGVVCRCQVQVTISGSKPKLK